MVLLSFLRLSIILSFLFALDLRANHLLFGPAKVIVLAIMVLRLRLLKFRLLERLGRSPVREAYSWALVSVDSVIKSCDSDVIYVDTHSQFS